MRHLGGHVLLSRKRHHVHHLGCRDMRIPTRWPLFPIHCQPYRAPHMGWPPLDTLPPASWFPFLSPWYSPATGPTDFPKDTSAHQFHALPSPIPPRSAIARVLRSASSATVHT